MYKKQLTYFTIICFEFFFNMEHSMAMMTLKQLAGTTLMLICISRMVLAQGMMSVRNIVEQKDIYIINPVLEMKKSAYHIVYYLEKLRA